MTIHFFAKPDKANDQDLEKFFNNFDLIQEHKQLIFDTPEYYNIRIAGLGCFPLYTPSIKLSIGELLKLWDETDWKQDDKYFYCITGSPLSGGNSSKYWSHKKGFKSMKTTVFTKQMRSALWLLQTGSTEIKSICTPVDPPEREVSKLTVNDLIAKLNSLPTDTIDIY